MFSTKELENGYGSKSVSVDRISEIERRLEAIDLERQSLAAELSALRAAKRSDTTSVILGAPAMGVSPKTPDEKVELFLNLF